MTIIEGVRRYLEKCPLLGRGRINIDFLPAQAATYSVDVAPVQPVIRQYMDGSSLRQFAFALSTRAYYGPLIRQQIDNVGFFEDFSGWLEDRGKKREYPELGEGKQALRLFVTTSGYVFAPDTDTARYQIQCRLEYFQKGER